MKNKVLIFPFFATMGFFSCQTTNSSEIVSADLVVMESTDLHANILGYDYYKDSLDSTRSLAQVYTLVKKIRSEYPNTMLIDNGDLLQGTPFASYFAKIVPLKKGELHPIYKAMNKMNYDVATLGNHEFNYGIDFLNNSIIGANFPYINANIYIDDKDKDQNNDKNAYLPYKIITKNIAGKDLKVGFIGVAPPQIAQWDKENLSGKLITKDMVASVTKFVPEMKKNGADLIIVLAHTGIDAKNAEEMQENTGYTISKISGVDGIFLGHSHMEFPGKKYADLNKLSVETSAEKGFLNGKPTAMAGFWGSHLGLLKFKLEYKGSKWSVTEKKSELISVKGVEPASEIVNSLQTEHKAVLEYVRSPIGTTDVSIHTYFARIADSAAVQIVNDAQVAYVTKALTNTKWANIPVLSAAAPFKVGFAGASDYTEIPVGSLAIKHMSDLYMFDNTLVAVELTGNQVKDWLEKSADNFAKIDLTKSEEQVLINPKFKGYNFDIIDGVNYEIDITKPVGQRIENLTFQGKPVPAVQKFIVATNNYRAFGGGEFPNLNGKNVVFNPMIENREIVIQYIKTANKNHFAADGNWKIKQIPSAKCKIIFESSASAMKFIANNMQLLVEEKSTNMAKFAYNLSK